MADLLLDSDEFIGDLENSLGRVIRKKEAAAKEEGSRQLNMPSQEFGKPRKRELG